jgi:ABC-2 type transport system permease protein
MSAAIFRIMLLRLVRDRGALAMSFLLPAIFFLIFATIAAATTGQDAVFKVAVADEVGNETAKRLQRALWDEPALTLLGTAGISGDEVRNLVRRGTADVGLIVSSNMEPAAQAADQNRPFLILVSDPTRGVAARLLSAQVHKAYLAALRELSVNGKPSAGYLRDADLGELLTREDVAGRSAGLNHIAYHAGAVAVLFLLFSAVHGALTLLEEKEAGILERIVCGPGSTIVLVNGKFLYLVAQGFVQVGVIFLVAWWVHGVDLPGHWIGWTIVTVSIAAAAAGMALAITAACTTKNQAQSIANVAVLIFSALGGSMVPRFLMPPLLQDIGWMTPNTWAIEGYAAIFWRDEPVSALLLPAGVLLGAAAVGLLMSQWLATRLRDVG